MRILYMGSGEFAVPTLASIHKDGHEIVGVVSQPDRGRGRGKAVQPTPTKAAALELGLDVITPADVNDPQVVAEIQSRGAELAFVAALGQKIGKALLNGFPVGIVNLHGSLLPALRGAAPVQWAVIRGFKETGVTVFRIVEPMDAGPVLVQRRTAIGIDETSEELHDRLARIGCDAARATIELLTEKPDTPGTPQDDSQATRAPKLKKLDGYIRLGRPTAEVARSICGLWSWPGATVTYRSADGRREERVTLVRAVPYEGRTQAAASPEAVGAITPMMSVQTADGEVSILEIKPAGGKRMAWPDFVNGRHVQPGDRFIPIEPTV